METRRLRPSADGAPEHLLLYDGACGMCHDLVRFVGARDTRRTLRYATLDGPEGAALLDAEPWLENAQSVVWVVMRGDERSIAVGSDATLALLRYLGGAWGLLACARVLPRRARDALHAYVVRHRHGGGPGRACPVSSLIAERRDTASGG